MLEIAKRFALPIGIALAFCVALVVVQSSEAFQDCIENAQYKAAQASNPKQISDIPITFVMRERCWGDYVHRYSDGIIALFTIILAGSTIALWLSTHFLWKVTDKTLKHAEKTTERQLRAYMFVDGGSFSWSANHSAFRATVVIKNYGQTPAYETEVYAKAALFPAGAPKFNFSKTGLKSAKSPLGPGATMNVQKLALARAADLSPVINRKKQIFVWGIVLYRDAFGNNETLEFRCVNQRTRDSANTWGMEPYPEPDEEG